MFGPQLSKMAAVQTKGLKRQNIIVLTWSAGFKERTARASSRFEEGFRCLRISHGIALIMPPKKRKCN